MSQDRYAVTDLAQLFDINCDIKSVMIPMRDGVKLHTLFYFPPEMPEKAPVMLVRSPYYRTTWFALPHAEAMENKCVFVTQSCRGTGWSEGGVFHPSNTDCEKNDAADLLDYIAEQPWFNGKCVMLGASYSGWTQWSAMRTGHKILVGTSPRVAPVYGCCGLANHGGGYSLAFTNWSMSMYHRRTYGYAGVPDYNKLKIFESVPVIDMDKLVYGKEIAVNRGMLECVAEPGKFLQGYPSYFDTMRVPAFISGGWFDGFKSEVIESFQLMKQRAATENARRFTRITIGPWAHAGLVNTELFGEINDYRDLLPRESSFLAALLNDPEIDPLPGDAPVKFFMLCENRWYDTTDWPPPGNSEKTYYLHSAGNANSCDGDGTISPEMPETELPDTYISDPMNPITASNHEEDNKGCYDRIFMEKSNNMLVYTSEKFTASLSVTGKVKLRFSASVSTPDTDFVATLTLFTPEGKSYLLTRGMIRARYRNSLDREELLTPEEICRYELDLGDIAVKFMPGYAMRLEICGQEFPTYGRNHNTGNPVLTDTEMRSAVCTILHDAEHPAELILPVNESF